MRICGISLYKNNYKPIQFKKNKQSDIVVVNRRTDNFIFGLSLFQLAMIILCLRKIRRL